jgi:hypothetical protein
VPRATSDFVLLSLSLLFLHITTMQPDTSPLGKTITTLLDTIASSAATFGELNDDARSLLATFSSRAWVAGLVIDGLKRADTYDIMKSGILTIQQLIQIAADAEKSSALGVYFRFYLGKKDKKRLYISSADDISVGTAAHNHQHGRGKGLHAATSKDAKTIYCRVLCNINDKACKRQKDGILALAEQLLVFLLGSYSDQISAYAPMSLHDHTATTDGTEDADAFVEVTGEIMEEFYEADPEVASLSDGDARARARQAILEHAGVVSTLYKRVGDTTCLVSGWEPATSRTNFNDGGLNIGTGLVTGLNITTPAGSLFDQVFWTRWTAADGSVSYRRPATNMATNFVVCTIGTPSKRVDIYQISRNSAPGKVNIPVGTKVHVVLEVFAGSKPHPRSWLGLPTTCLMEDAERADSLAVHLEWRNDAGETQIEYLRYINSPLYYNTAPGHEGQFDGMGIAVGILDYLENQVVVGGRRPFLRYFGTARMLNQTRDYLRQLIELEIETEAPFRAQDDGPRPYDVIHQELVDAGAHGIDQEFGTFSAPATDSCETRTRCDRCEISNGLTHHPGGLPATCADREKLLEICSAPTGADDCQCVRARGTNTCTNCQKTGIPCTYTVGLFDKPPLCRALWFAPVDDSVQTIDDPGYFDRVSYDD